LQLRVFRFGSDEHGDVRVGVLSEGKEILVSGFGFGGIALYRVGASQSQPGQCAPREVRASSDFDFDGHPVEQLSDVELLQILARGQDMTSTKFLRIARGYDVD
jgi:hypothetical protein